MRIILQKHTSVYVIMASLFCAIVLIAGISLATRAQAASQEPVSAGKHLITLHDNGQEKGLLTTADTLRAAFKEAKIAIDPNDLVEPGLDSKLVASHYEVNVYRARPITIIDGSVKQKVLSPYQTARQVAAHANITLQDEDTTTLLANNDIMSEGAGLTLRVSRATAFTFILYGKRIEAYTQAKTVGEMLQQKNVSLKEADTLSVSASTPVVTGMTVELWRNGKQVVTEDQAIAFAIDQTKDADQPAGYKKVTTPGVDGKRTVSFEVDMKNGKEVSRTEIQSVTTLEPVRQVEIIGAKQKSFGGTCDVWMSSAGISDMSNASYLIEKESHCNPYAVNKSSGACGVGQALPCSKTGCEMGDGACQVVWMNKYVLGRYGSWQAAADHHRTKGWY